MGLPVGREPAVGDPVEISQPGVQTSREGFPRHPIQHIDARLAVFCCRDRDHALTQGVVDTAHQDNFVAHRRQRSLELRHGRRGNTAIDRRHLNPVRLRDDPVHHGTSDQVAGDKRAPHLKGQPVVLPGLIHIDARNLSAGGRNNHLAADSSHLLDKHLQHTHRLADRQSVDRQIRDPEFVQP